MKDKFRHTFEFQLNLVSQALNGRSLADLGRSYRTNTRDIRMWVRRYKLYGEAGLYSSIGNRFSIEEKEKIVTHVIANKKSLSLPQLALYHNVSYGTLLGWLHKVNKGGLQALREPNVSKRKPKDRLPMARPKKKEPTTELERLRLEVYRLRAENELLKKVKALVQAREARERMIGLKSSKN